MNRLIFKNENYKNFYDAAIDSAKKNKGFREFEDFYSTGDFHNQIAKSDARKLYRAIQMYAEALGIEF